MNHFQIPVNAPRCPYHSYDRDGAMRVDGNYGAALSYTPNSEGQWSSQPEYRESPLPLEGAADHWNHRTDDDYLSQPGNLFRLMSDTQKQMLFDNTARAITGASDVVKQRHVANCHQATLHTAQAWPRQSSVLARDTLRRLRLHGRQRGAHLMPLREAA